MKESMNAKKRAKKCGRERLLFFACLALILAVFTAAASPAAAGSYGTGYDTKSFDVEVTVDENHVYHVKETITVDFALEKHGLFRYIPYDLGVYNIENIQVDGYPFETETLSENGVFQKIIKIGDADKTLTGRQVYQISYDVTGYADKDAARDFFSIDALPTGWETDIEKTDITVKMPKSIDPDTLQIYSGSYGMKENFANIKADYNPKTCEISISAKNLYQGAGITLSAELPEGYWVNPVNRDWMQYLLMGILIAVPVLMAVLWAAFGRDKKVVKTVEFYPPQGLTPAEIGYVIDGAVDTKDLTSMLTYFADKGYLSIREYTNEKFELMKLTDISVREKRFAKTFFNGIFEAGDLVRLDQLPDSFGEVFMLAKTQLKDYYCDKNALFTRGSKNCRAAGLLLTLLLPLATLAVTAIATFEYLYAVLLFFVLIFTGAGLLTGMTAFDRKETYSRAKKIVMAVIAALLSLAGVLTAAVITFTVADWAAAAVLSAVSFAVSFAFVLLMEKRTEFGVMLQGKILGFRDFIEAAELEKLKLLAEEDPQYFYKVMPYAYVMGLSDKWIKNFEQIPTKAPDWYDGGGPNTAFNVFWYGHMFRNCTGSFASQSLKSVAAGSADTGSGGIGGGFGGGGFSGGGFGGGGGGAW